MVANIAATAAAAVSPEENAHRRRPFRAAFRSRYLQSGANAVFKFIEKALGHGVGHLFAYLVEVKFFLP